MKNTTDPRLLRSLGDAERQAQCASDAPALRGEVPGRGGQAHQAGDAEQFLLAQARDGRAPRTRNIYLASIRWLLRAAGRRDVTALLRQARVSKALGTVLSGSDVERLLAAVTPSSIEQSS